MGKLSEAFLRIKGVYILEKPAFEHLIEEWLDEFARDVAFQAYHEGYFNSLNEKDMDFDKWWEEINKEQ